MITKATSPGYLYTVTTDSACIITDVDTRYNLCKAVVNKQGMFAAIGGSVECSDDNVVLTQASAVSGGTRFEVVTTRPEIGETGVIYLVPASNSTTENLYEEWVWVDDKWEQIGSAGLNLSNYAQLTTSNTFSAANTFNGNLIKKTSSSLADNSVLNRSEADARYGRLAKDNFWYGDQHIGASGTLTMHPNATIITNSIQGNADVSSLSFNSLHLTDITDINTTNIYASTIHVSTIHADTLKTKEIRATQSNNKITFVSSIGSGSVDISGIKDLRLASVHAANAATAPTINTNTIAPISGGSIQLQNISELVARASATYPQATLSGMRYLKYGDNIIDLYGGDTSIAIKGSLVLSTTGSSIELKQGIISGVQTLQNNGVGLVLDSAKKRIIAGATNVPLEVIALSGVQTLQNNQVRIICDASSIPSSKNAMLVASPEGIKVTDNINNTSAVTMSLYKIEALQLDTDSFGENKYGLRLTPDSCQLFGVDFAYGDVWAETNDALKAQGATPIPGLDSANYIDTVKIKKPAISIETTGIGSLSFDYANEAYIRTFPNDGGQGIFEFQAGNWTSDERKFIKRGPVDLRKASATELGPTSVLNMEEGDARWGGSETVLVDRKIPDWMVTPQTELIAVSDVGPGGAFGVAIGPGVTANVYNDMAIGGWLDTSPGRGGNTLLGYGFKVIPNARRAVAIGYAETNSAIHNSAIVIGNECTARGKNIIAIGGNVSGNLGIALNGVANSQSIALGGIAKEAAIAVGYYATAEKLGTALGNYSVAGINEFVMQTGGTPSISMQLYGGTNWDSHDTTGYLKFVVAPSAVEIGQMNSTEREEIIIHKKPLWDAIQRAKDYNYPAQPFVSLVGDNGEVPSALANAQPNTIYHIVVGALDINLTDMMFDTSIPGIASAELHFEIPSGTTPSVTWPDIMIWPDESDPSVAPILSGSASGNKLYAIAVRKQITRAGEFLVASIAYSFEY